jgi:hypothetical protein
VPSDKAITLKDKAGTKPECQKKEVRLRGEPPIFLRVECRPSFVRRVGHCPIAARPRSSAHGTSYEVLSSHRMVTTSFFGFGWIDQLIGDSVFGVLECGIERDASADIP